VPLQRFTASRGVRVAISGDSRDNARAVAVVGTDLVMVRSHWLWPLPRLFAGLHHRVGLQPSLWLPGPVHHSLAERYSVCAYPGSHRASGKGSPRPPA
jgi:hypothetical protein